MQCFLPPHVLSSVHFAPVEIQVRRCTQQNPLYRWMPKGVNRFKTHEEADAGMTKMLARSGLP